MKKIMKKIIFITSAVLIALFFTGCLGCKPDVKTELVYVDKIIKVSVPTRSEIPLPKNAHILNCTLEVDAKSKFACVMNNEYILLHQVELLESTILDNNKLVVPITPIFK